MDFVLFPRFRSSLVVFAVTFMISLLISTHGSSLEEFKRQAIKGKLVWSFVLK